MANKRVVYNAKWVAMDEVLQILKMNYYAIRRNKITPWGRKRDFFLPKPSESEINFINLKYECYEIKY